MSGTSGTTYLVGLNGDHIVVGLVGLLMLDMDSARGRGSCRW